MGYPAKGQGLVLARLGFGERNKGIVRVVLCNLVALFVATGLTFVGNAVIVGPTFEAHWFHLSQASALPVSRGRIHMLAPETLRAVVGVAVAHHHLPAVLALKILLSSYKCHRGLLYRYLCLFLNGYPDLRTTVESHGKFRTR